MLKQQRLMALRGLFATLMLGATIVPVPAALAETFGPATQPQRQTVPCRPDNSNCPWKKIKDKEDQQASLPSDGQWSSVQPEETANKAGNPCTPGGSSSGCRDWILGNPKPPIRPKR